MKLTYFQLDHHLRTTLSPVYMVSGEEWLLKQEALHIIKERAKHAGFKEEMRLSQETPDEEAIYSLLHSTSFFGEKRLIEINFRDELPTKNVANLLAEYALNPNQNTVLIVEGGKIDAKTAKSAWCTTIEKMGTIVTIWSISREQLPQWIKLRAKKFNLEINEQAITFIVEYTEGNLLAASQVIEKLALFKPNSVIASETIQAFLNDESKYSVFDLNDCLITGDKSRFIKILQNLAKERTEPALVLWCLVRELRILSDMAQQLKMGVSFAEVCKKHRIFPRRQGILRNFLHSTRIETCHQLLQRATEIDKFIKGAAVGNVWQLFELLILTM